MAANIGFGFKFTDSLKLVADLWYAKLVEKNAAGDDELGTEIDVVLTYSLMKNLNLDLVAEGVETREQASLLRDKGCPCIQGYFCSRPFPPEGLGPFIERVGKEGTL
jgi:predicted signal transduction protein with EAL and GGDEF domain